MPLETSKREAKRQQLFRAALKVMGEQGFKDASVNEITRAAGVSRSVFYYYFESKADLVEKMMQASSESMFGSFNDAVKPGMSTLDIFCTVARVTYEEVFKDPDITKFIFSEVWHREEEWREVLGEGMNEVISIYADLIERGQEEGIFDPAINVSFASQMMFSVICTTAAACRDGYIECRECDDIGEQVVRFVYLGLAHREKPAKNYSAKS